MMSGPNLLSAVLRMNAKAFLGEVRHVGETESALEILKKRYAKGEITKEQFDLMKKDIADD
jgi:uncharacterized membrane protein